MSFLSDRPGARAIFLILLIFPLLCSKLSAQLSLSQISSPDQLPGGPNAEAQIGDYLFANDFIHVIVTDTDHQSQYTNTGGHIIDADYISGAGDRFSCLFTYLDNEFPNQANYNQAEIINDGSNNDRAILRLTGVYSENSQLEILTEYSLDLGETYITVQTWLINNSGSPFNGFGLGDAIQWGSTFHFAPGYGFEITGLTTTEPWLCGAGDGVSYGYSVPSGMLSGPNGSFWSDPVSYDANIPAGDTVTYIRYLTLGNGDIASAINIVYQLRGESTGSISGQVVDTDTDEGLGNAVIDINFLSGDPYSQIITLETGGFEASLPPEDYRLTVSKLGYTSQELDITILSDSTLELYIELSPDSGSGEYPLGDTLTYILRPLSNIPVIVKRDSIFSIEVEAGESANNWQAGLILDHLDFNLNIESVIFISDAQRWYIQAGIPDSIPFALYDLRIAATGIADTAKNAVKIIDDYRSEFYFIQITDTHLPTHIFHYEPGGLDDTSSMTDLLTLIDDFETINPEFVLLTGDVVNEGELEDYLGFRCYSRAKNLLGNFTVPVYVAPGNHDLGGWNDTPPPAGTARRDWWRFFGWNYLDQTSGPGPFTQDYYFDYGNIRFIELEAYDNYDSWRYQIYGGESFTALQIAWLNDVIAFTDPSKSIVTFNHYDFQDQLNLSAMGIDLNLYGHIHRDQGSIYDQPFNLATNNVCDGERSFRVIYYDSSGFHPQPSFSSGSYGQNLTVNFSPGNDGTHDSVTAAIVNNYNFNFNHGQIIFNMPPAEGYSVSNGELWQTIGNDSTAQCYVELYITAGSITSVTITANPEIFLPGDANGDGIVIGSDVTYLVQYFAGNNPPPDPFYAGDANGDCQVIGSDVTYLVNYFRNTGPPPVMGDCE